MLLINKFSFTSGIIIQLVQDIALLICIIFSSDLFKFSNEKNHVLLPNKFSFDMIFEHLKPEIETIVSDNNKTVDERLLNICELLEKHIEYYNWVGFYFRNGDKEELVLGPYVGEPTDHTVIPFGKGICGQVAVSNENFVVPDVSAQDNYIACSITVKAEIVIPIFVNGKNIGQIDIDSNTPDPFTEADERFLEFICKQVSSILQ